MYGKGKKYYNKRKRSYYQSGYQPSSKRRKYNNQGYSGTVGHYAAIPGAIRTGYRDVKEVTKDLTKDVSWLYKKAKAKFGYVDDTNKSSSQKLYDSVVDSEDKHWVKTDKTLSGSEGGGDEGLLYGSYTWRYPLLYGITQGVASHQRVGQELMLKSLEISLSFNSRLPTRSSWQLDTVDRVEHATYRMMVVYDKTPQKSKFSTTDLFETYSDPGISYYDNMRMQSIRALYNRNRHVRSRFLVLYDKVKECSFKDKKMYCFHNIKLDLNKLPVVYDNTGNSLVENVIQGQMYFIICRCVSQETKVYYTYGTDNYVQVGDFRVTFCE